ncbi:MAG: heme-dependent oxidative N-demethylase family protein [Pseudomonadota bacterium]
MDTVVLHPRLPFAPWADPRTRRLPGILPLDPADWLVVDEVYAEQMRLRDRLIAEREPEVHALLPRGEAAAAELYAAVLARLPDLGFTIEAGQATRPDGVTVPLDPARPLRTLGRLCQEDFCLMDQGAGEDEPVLTGAILCFPSGWRLSEKIGRAMVRIHRPVAKYDADVARRVQRLFDAIRPEQPLWRANAHFARAPLFNPLSEAQGKDLAESEMPWIRSERQCLLRLPQTRAVVFSIHTYLVPLAALSPEQAAALAEHTPHRAP